MGDGRLGKSKRLDQVANADRLAVIRSEQIDDAHPRWIGERLKQLGRRFGFLVGQNLCAERRAAVDQVEIQGHVPPLGVNLGLVYLASRWIGERDDFPIAEGLFFAALGTLILWLYDA